MLRRIGIYPFAGGIGTSTVTLMTAMNLARWRKTNVVVPDHYTHLKFEARCGLASIGDYDSTRYLDDYPDFSFGPRILDSSYIEFVLNRPMLRDNIKYDQTYAFIDNSYNALRAVTQSRIDFDGYILWLTPNRALNERDVTSVMNGTSLIATNVWDDSVARRDDAGLLISREMPRQLLSVVDSLMTVIKNKIQEDK